MAETLPAPLVDLADIGSQAADFARASRAVATMRAYRADWADFSAWCESVGRERLPVEPEMVGLYLTARSRDLKVATLRRRVASIAVAHKLAGHRLDTRHPAIADVLAGIRRELGARASPKNAISVDELRAMLRKLPDTITGTRDRAILLIGFAGAFRRSELTALDVVDLNVNSRGVAITVRRSKTDQQGYGQTIGIPRSRKATCSVAALEAWLLQGSITAGPVFRPISRHGHISDLRLSDEALDLPRLRLVGEPKPCGDSWLYPPWQRTDVAIHGAILGALALVVSASAALACGTERWPVKTGTDRDAASVANFPTPTTVAQLGSVAAPAHPGLRPNSRFSPTELTTFQITGILKLIKKETDQDYHLVIADPTNPATTMIVEAPDPNCARGSQFLDNISFVRQVLDQKFGRIIRLEPNIPVTVTGVAFFDLKHNQEGIALNGIELHPVLVIAFH